MCNIRSRFADVAIGFAHDTDVFVTVEEGILFIARSAPPSGSVGLETGVG